MLFKSLFTAVTALSLFSMSSFANDEVSGTDVLPYLITTGDPDDPKFGNTPENPAFKNGVGSIFIEFTSTTPGGFICTASAISPIHILTAGHCLRNGADTITRVRFILPNNAALEPLRQLHQAVLVPCRHPLHWDSCPTADDGAYLLRPDDF